jgi:hypothetical protein
MELCRHSTPQWGNAVSDAVVESSAPMVMAAHVDDPMAAMTASRARGKGVAKPFPIEHAGFTEESAPHLASALTIASGRPSR